MSTAEAWDALADPRRRAALDVLRARPSSVNDLAERLGLSQPSTSKHLRILREAELVTVRQDGNRRVYSVAGRPLAEMHAWLAGYRSLWDEHLDALERRLDDRHTRGGSA